MMSSWRTWYCNTQPVFDAHYRGSVSAMMSMGSTPRLNWAFRKVAQTTKWKAVNWWHLIPKRIGGIPRRFGAILIYLFDNELVVCEMRIERDSSCLSELFG